MSDFRKKIINEGPLHLLIPQGKAYFLYQNIMDDLTLHDFTFGVLKRMFYTKRVLFLNLRQAPLALMVDSIRKGNEVKYFSEMIENVGGNLVRVFSYLTCEEGLKKLKSEGFPTEKIVSHKTVPLQKYRHEYDRIQIYLQSRIHPLREGSPYVIYMTSQHVGEAELIPLITNSIASGLNCDEIKFEKDKFLHLPNDLQTYSFACRKVNDCDKNVNLFARVPRMGKIDFETFKLGIKMNYAKQGTTFRIATLCPLFCFLKGIVPARMQMCPYRELTRTCSLKGFPAKQRRVVKNSVCNLCINYIVSNYILDMISSEIDSELRRSGIKFSRRRFSPI